MASALSLVGIGTTIAGGLTAAQGAQVSAAGQETQIEGQILSTIGKAYSFDVQAQEYGYKAGISDYQQAVALENKRIALSNADYSRQVGEVEAQQSGMKTRAELGQIMAVQGASGIDVASGSSAMVRQSTIELGNYDEATIRANAAKTAYGYEVEATQDQAQSDIYKMTSDLERTQAADATTAAGITRQAIPLEYQAMGYAAQAGQIGATSSILSAAGSVASKWLSGTQSGALPSFGFG